MDITIVLHQLFSSGRFLYDGSSVGQRPVDLKTTTGRLKVEVNTKVLTLLLAKVEVNTLVLTVVKNLLSTTRTFDYLLTDIYRLLLFHLLKFQYVVRLVHVSMTFI